jgi:hypothetical protein
MFLVPRDLAIMATPVVHPSLYAAGGVILPIRSLDAPPGTPAGEARSLLLDLVDDARDKAHLLLQSPAVASVIADVTNPDTTQLRLLREMITWKTHTRRIALERTRWRRAGRIGRVVMRAQYALGLGAVPSDLLPVVQGPDSACVPFAVPASLAP